MATLGDIREYAVEMAAWDASDAKADRVINRWINQALSRISSSHNWGWFNSWAKINVDVKVTGTDLSLTQDSKTVTFSGSKFVDKYVDQLWDLVVDGDTDFYRFAEVVDASTARLETAYIGDTDSAATFELFRTLFSLPDDARQVFRVEDMNSNIPLSYLCPAEMDSLRQDNVGLDDSYPTHYTIRGNKIQIWPSPSDTRRSLAISYRRKPTRVKVTDDDLVEVDWPEAMLDLLERAIELEAARTQGENAQIPYPLAKTEFEEALSRYKSEDTVRAHRQMAMNPTMPFYPKVGGRRFYRNPGSLGDPA